MVSIVEQIITELEGHTFTIPSVTVKETYNPEKPSYPLITIDEMPSNEGIRVDGQPRIVSNLYTVECYCRATDLTGSGGGILSPKAAARLLGIETDTFLNTNFNFSQFGDSICRPANTDNTVYRFISRYATVIDDNPTDPDNVYMYR